MSERISIRPANAASCEELSQVFGTRGPAARRQCQRYKLARRESFAQHPPEVGRPSIRRAVMRIDM